ncbi:alpha/beta-hydrolase [Glonium stellatum]|uniref:Alpha/beta-hydrolase n=1 Tax=Glonium stellatum TaxID=574774 RepID=A0A8E2F2R5_9PEZI|nr:alpha/beta-hydrolase [Glonium stellatum]
MSSLSPPRPSKFEIQALGPLSPELRELLNTTGPWPDPPFTDTSQCRSISDFADGLLLKALGPTPATLEEITLSIPVSSSYSSHTTLTRPSAQSQKPPGPLIVLFHPGGFFLGSPLKLTPYARGLASLFSATVVCPSYRVAPEHPFPTGIDDAWTCMQWAATNAAALGADPSSRGFIVGGVSSGANFAAVLARRAVVEELRPQVTGIWAPLSIGLAADTVPGAYAELWTSREQNRDALVIDQAKARTMFEHYRPDFASPLFNPLASGFDLAKMPRAFVQVAGADLFRDDGLVYAYALQGAGVEVRLETYPGVPHSFWVFAPALEVSRKCVRDIVEGFAWLLRVETEGLGEGWEGVMRAPEVKLE